jgi:hypothetical protein
MAVVTVPEGRLTAVGVALVAVVPLPSSPSELAPHMSTPPLDVNASLEKYPPDTAETVVPEGRLTATGDALLVVVPLPSSLSVLSPQASAVPLAVTARLWA